MVGALFRLERKLPLSVVAAPASTHEAGLVGSRPLRIIRRPVPRQAHEPRGGRIRQLAR